ncbi:hypothetical protein TKK_0016595 [Trichogramma kaykai]
MASTLSTSIGCELMTELILVFDSSSDFVKVPQSARLMLYLGFSVKGSGVASKLRTILMGRWSLCPHSSTRQSSNFLAIPEVAKIEGYMKDRIAQTS